MRVAEVSVTFSGGWPSMNGFVQIIAFDDLAVATSEYERVADLLKKRDDKANDLPKIVEFKGINQASIPLNTICAIGLTDLKKSDEGEMGLRDTFPHLRWKD